MQKMPAGKKYWRCEAVRSKACKVGAVDSCPFSGVYPKAKVLYSFAEEGNPYGKKRSIQAKLQARTLVGNANALEEHHPWV